jgi:hypothetical protein
MGTGFSLPLPNRKGRNGQDDSNSDDSPIIREMLCRLFEVEEDYDICAETTNGQEAIDSFEE